MSHIAPYCPIGLISRVHGRVGELSGLLLLLKDRWLMLTVLVYVLLLTTIL